MQIISRSVKDTLKIGRMLALSLHPQDIVCLFGALGSGKTVLTKGIAQGLRVSSSEVISPSFVLFREYPQGAFPLFHFDLYRLEGPQDILGLGYEEYFYDDAITVIEWADRLGRLLPEEFLKIELLTQGRGRRRIKISAFGSRYQKLYRKIRENFSR
jgi:tRNA threonylcarbamoyladenosine biosynthesis protein TsaE